MITNRIVIIEISSVKPIIAIWNRFAPVYFIYYNSICNQISNSNDGFNTRDFNYYNSICNHYNYICNDYNSFEIDDIRFLSDPIDASV